jgi:hypothetical protein
MFARSSAFCIVLAASPVLAADTDCEGPFAADSSARLLEEVFGKDNVITGETDGPEGAIVIATMVFPNDPQEIMTFVWQDQATYQNIAYVELAPNATIAGLSRGMSVSEVEALNGEPFTLSGLWWDYGGYAEFASGRLAMLPGGCSVSIYFEPTQYADEGVDVRAISGDKEVLSTEPLLETVAAKIAIIMISYPNTGK